MAARDSELMMAVTDLEAIAAKGFRFIMYNQRGGGRSELVTDKSKLGIDYYVRDLEALRQHFGLTNARLLLIPNAGHMNWLDQPEVVISSINEFFRGRQIRTAKQLRGS